MSSNRAQLERYAKQSEVRVRSGTRLVGFFVLLALIAWSFDGQALAKLSGVCAAFFSVVTLAEYLNARRKRARARVTACD
jgi:hypothetical protein